MSRLLMLTRLRSLSINDSLLSQPKLKNGEELFNFNIASCIGALTI